MSAHRPRVYSWRKRPNQTVCESTGAFAWFITSEQHRICERILLKTSCLGLASGNLLETDSDTKRKARSVLYFSQYTAFTFTTNAFQNEQSYSCTQRRHVVLWPFWTKWMGASCFRKVHVLNYTMWNKAGIDYCHDATKEEGFVNKLILLSFSENWGK